MNVIQEATSSSREIPWQLSDFLLPLLVTFITYVITQILIAPKLRWRDLKDDMIVISVQYANYKAYSYVKGDKRIFEDRGLHTVVEQELRKLAGRVYALQFYPVYRFWLIIGLLPNKEQLVDIRSNLIGWANSLVEMDLKYDINRDVFIEALKKDLEIPNNYEKMKELQELKIRNSKD